MPSHPRGEVFDPRQVNTLHCYCRFAQQYWLFGEDPKTGEDGSSRRAWLDGLLEFVARLFAINIGFTSTMTNHFHLIIRNLPHLVDGWSDDVVIWRWVQISHLTKSKDGILREPTEEQLAKEWAKCQADPDRIAKLRVRLADPSEFMKCINENLGRRLNAETGASGRVFEERFQAKPIYEEGAELLAALYVDLNPVRAGEVDRIEDARFSSAYQRLTEWLSQNASEGGNAEASPPSVSADGKSSEPAEPASTSAQDAPAPASSTRPGAPAPRAPRAAWLGPVELQEGPDVDLAELNGPSATPWRASDKGWLPITLEEYLSLLDWTAREVRADKRGATPENLAPLLVRVGLNPDVFVDYLLQFRKLFRFAIGSPAKIQAAAQANGKSRRPLKATDKLFTSA